MAPSSTAPTSATPALASSLAPVACRPPKRSAPDANDPSAQDEPVATIELFGPLGVAVVESTVEPPRCYPRSITYGRYMNHRFALAADIPRFLEKYGREAGNADGATFSLGSEAEISVWGAHNLDVTAPMSEEKSRQKKLVEARELAPGESLISLVRDGHIITRVSVLEGKRTMRTSIYEDGLEASAQITYDQSLKAYFEPIEHRLRTSLRTIGGGMYERPTKPPR